MAVRKTQSLYSHFWKCGFAASTRSHRKRLFTVQIGKQVCLVTSQCSTWSCTFCIVFYFPCVDVMNFLWLASDFSKYCKGNIDRRTQMVDQEVITNMRIIVSDNNNQERQKWVCLGQTWFQISCCLFVSTLYQFVDCIRWLLEKSSLEILWQTKCLDGNFCVVHQDTFYPRQDYEQVYFY